MLLDCVMLIRSDSYVAHRKIKRVIFESMHKWNGGAIVALTLPQVKQIGGRAGRYGMHSPTPGNSVADLDNDIPTQPQPSVGQVTTLDPEDLPLLKKAMAASVSPIQRAVIMPHAEQLSSLSKVVASGVPFSRILALARMFGRTSPNYTLPIHAASIIVTALLDKYSQLTPEELRTLAVAPVSTRDDRGVETFQCFVQSHVDSKPFNLVEWAHQQGLSDLLPGHVQTTSPSAKQVAAISGGDLLSLESCHKSMSLYLWLSYRLPLTFDQPEIARGLRRNIEVSVVNQRT